MGWRVPDQSPIKLVCFDLGGVLVRIVRDWGEALQRAGVDPARCNVDPTEVQIDTAFEFELGNLTTEQFIETHRQTNPAMTPQEIHAVIRHWLVGVYEGVGGLLDDLATQNVATACLSNTNAAHWEVMCDDPSYTDLRKLDHMLASHEIGCRKPHPDAFRHVERTTGVAIREIVFFDDSQANHAAALAHGWSAHRIDPQADPVRQIRQRLHECRVLPDPTESFQPNR